MTSNKALFKQMFLQKRRYADLVLLVQVFAVAFMFLYESGVQGAAVLL